MKCVIYSRFSPRKNADQSESCETQEQLCEEHARAQGWVVKAKYRDEGVSGKVVDRPGLAKAVGALGKGDILLVYKRDRIARSQLLSELTRHKVMAAKAKIVAVSGDVAGEDDDPMIVLIRQVFAAFAEFERKQIAIRTRDAMLAKQRQGRRMGRFAPYGYRVDPEDPTILQKDAAEQEAIRRILQLAKSGGTPHGIAKTMNEEMPSLSRGASWQTKTVAKIIRRAS